MSKNPDEIVEKRAHPGGGRPAADRRRPNGLSVERSVHDVFQRDPDSSALRHRLRHEDYKHLLFRINPEGCSAGAGPIHLTHRAFRRTRTDFSTDCKTESEPETRSRQVIGTGHHARARPDMVRTHISHGLRAEISPSVQT